MWKNLSVLLFVPFILCAEENLFFPTSMPYEHEEDPAELPEDWEDDVQSEDLFEEDDILLCDEEEKSCSISMRYIQGSGIGYEHSYTTLEAFLSPIRGTQTWNPYLDFRGHVFNNGKIAANAGLGMRYISSIVYGANAYYDYRNTSRFQYNQIGAGLEMIGSFWGLTMNGYLPFGRKKTPFFNPSITGTSTTTDSTFFQGNQIFIQLSGTEALLACQEFALKGVTANAVFRILKKDNFSVDFAAGPYYFDGYYDKYALGGQGTASIRLKDRLSLSLIGSYDNLFHTRIQGSFALSIPLGPKSVAEKDSKSLCTTPSFYNEFFARGAQRSEIIVLDRYEKILADAATGSVSVAINPSTGAPYLIWFVNNTSSSEGTYESPFPTLAAAESISQPNDLIYVFPGDGTDLGMNTGIVLKNGQQLLGSGAAVVLATTQGTIVIQKQSTVSPLITNAGATVISLANQNTVSGIHLGASATGFSGSSIENLQIFSCQADASSLPVNLNEFSGLATLAGNTFTNYPNQAVNLTASSAISQLSLNSNLFTAQIATPNTFGVSATLSGSSQMALTLADNVFSEHTDTAIRLVSSDSAILNPTISGNTITAPAGGSGTGAISINHEGLSSIVVMSENTSSGDFTLADISLTAKGALTGTISNNTCGLFS